MGHSDEPGLPVECRDADLSALLIEEGRGESETPHKTRCSLPSQVSGKLTDKENEQCERDKGVKVFFKRKKKRESVSILKCADDGNSGKRSKVMREDRNMERSGRGKAAE